MVVFAISLIISLLIMVFVLSVVCFIVAERRGKTVDFSDKVQLEGTRWEKYSDKIAEGIKWIEQAKGEDVSIKSNDGLTLCGRYIPNGISRKTVLLFHGYRSVSKNDFSCLAGFYYDHGFNVLLADQRSHGKSEGKFIGFGVLERHDCKKWIDYINNRFDYPDIILEGISMGATTVLMASELNLPANVKAIISDCGFTSPEDIISTVMKRDFKILKFPVYYIVSLYSKIFAGYFLNELSSIDSVKNTSIPMLFIHGSEDSFVPVKMSEKIFNACASTCKELCIIDGAKHAECYAKNKEQYESCVMRFIERAA